MTTFQGHFNRQLEISFRFNFKNKSPNQKQKFTYVRPHLKIVFISCRYILPTQKCQTNHPLWVLSFNLSSIKYLFFLMTKKVQFMVIPSLRNTRKNFVSSIPLCAIKIEIVRRFHTRHPQCLIVKLLGWMSTSNTNQNGVVLWNMLKITMWMVKWKLFKRLNCDCHWI